MNAFRVAIDSGRTHPTDPNRFSLLRFSSTRRRQLWTDRVANSRERYGCLVRDVHQGEERARQRLAGVATGYQGLSLFSFRHIFFFTFKEIGRKQHASRVTNARKRKKEQRWRRPWSFYSPVCCWPDSSHESRPYLSTLVEHATQSVCVFRQAGEMGKSIRQQYALVSVALSITIRPCLFAFFFSSFLYFSQQWCGCQVLPFRGGIEIQCFRRVSVIFARIFFVAIILLFFI